jgi:hypothetical protein
MSMFGVGNEQIIWFLAACLEISRQAKPMSAWICRLSGKLTNLPRS